MIAGKLLACGLGCSDDVDDDVVDADDVIGDVNGDVNGAVTDGKYVDGELVDDGELEMFLPIPTSTSSYESPAGIHLLILIEYRTLCEGGGVVIVIFRARERLFAR